MYLILIANLGVIITHMINKLLKSDFTLDQSWSVTELKKPSLTCAPETKDQGRIFPSGIF